MEIVLTCIYTIFFYYIIRKSNFFKTGGVKAWLPGAFFLLKCLSGILLGLLYTYYYTNYKDADSFKFFTDSKIMFDTLFTRPADFIRMFTGFQGKSPDILHYYMDMNAWLNTSPLYNDNKTLVRLNAFFRFFSFGHYYVHVIFINFISFTGLFCLYKTFISYCDDKKTELLVFTFMMPSILFWGSGLLKDGLLITGFGILLYSYSQILLHGFTKRRLFYLLIGLTILVFTKAYVLALILPALIAWWITRNWSTPKTILTFIGIYAIYFITAFNLYHYNDDYNVAALIFYKQKNFIEIGDQHAATMIPPPVFECSGPSIMVNSLKAFSNTFLRPFLTDVHGNPMVLLSALENLLIVFMLIISVLSFRRVKKETIPFLMFNIVFVLLLFILIGLITPILGAIVRYRIVALPSLAFIFIHFYNRENFLNRFPFLKRKKKPF